MDKGGSPYGPAPPLQYVSVSQGTLLVPPHTQNATQDVEYMSWFGRPVGCCNPKIGPDKCPGAKCCCCEPRCV